jgi:tetratricopeptide (TPR) repeat protein
MNTPGRLPDAIAEFKTAIGIDPDYVEAHYNLAACLSRMPGRESDAIAEFEAALRIRPDFEPAEAALQRMRPAGR